MGYRRVWAARIWRVNELEKKNQKKSKKFY